MLNAWRAGVSKKSQPLHNDTLLNANECSLLESIFMITINRMIYARLVFVIIFVDGASVFYSSILIRVQRKLINIYLGVELKFVGYI